MNEGPAIASGDGMYVCGRCGQVASPSERVIAEAENAPAGSQEKLKCAHCGKRAVEWHPPSRPDFPKACSGNVVVKPEPPPVDHETGRQLLAKMRETLSLL